MECGEELSWLCHNFTTILGLTSSLPLETGGVDVFFQKRNCLFLKCRPGIITYCLNSCCLKTSIPQTPQRAESAGLALEGTATKTSRDNTKSMWKNMSENPISLQEKCHLLP